MYKEENKLTVKCAWEECAVVFKTKQGNHKYCSSSCSQKARDAVAKAESKLLPGYECKAVACDNMIERGLVGQPKYCCHTCRDRQADLLRSIAKAKKPKTIHHRKKKEYTHVKKRQGVDIAQTAKMSTDELLDTFGDVE